MESLLLSAPPGHLDSLIKNLSTLTTVPDDLVSKVQLESTVPSEICDHALATALEESFQAHKAEFYSSLDHYKVSITKTTTTTTTTTTSSSESQLTLRTHAERMDSKNCHAGSWRGTWTIDIVSESAVTLSGSIRVHAYYHEDCNVQMKTHKTYDAMSVETSSNNVNDVAKSIQNKIATMEADVAVLLEEMYRTMDDKLKALRRVLPITRTRLEWNILAHRMVKKLEETAK